MIGSSGVNALLRSGISDGFDIAFCDIRIELQRDLAHAHYVYTYGLVKKAIADDEWREVFAYREDEFAMEFARPGRPTDHDTRTNLQTTLRSLPTPARNTCLNIAFHRQLDIGDEYEFHYACHTKIEAVKNVTFLGGTGCVWYWCAHEYACHAISVTFILPRGVHVTNFHPRASVDGEQVKFSHNSLLPNEFFTPLVTYEKRVVGIPLQIAKWANAYAGFVGGVVASILGALLFELIRRG